MPSTQFNHILSSFDTLDTYKVLLEETKRKLQSWFMIISRDEDIDALLALLPLKS